MEPEQVDELLAIRARSSREGESFAAKALHYTDLARGSADDYAREHYLRIAEHAQCNAQLQRDVARAAEGKLRLAHIAF